MVMGFCGRVICDFETRLPKKIRARLPLIGGEEEKETRVKQPL
jgi:hypothetical protein